MSDERPRTWEVLGILMRFHAFPADVGGKYCLVEAVVPPGLGAPPNTHAGETEAFHVIEGCVAFHVDGRDFEAGPGEHVRIPDGALHAFRAVGDSPARILVLNAPGDMHDQFFTSLGKPVADDTKMPAPVEGPPDIKAVLAVAERVGMKIFAPAPA